MTEPSYIDLFYPERFISLEGNLVSDIEPFDTLVAHVQCDLVRWMIFWDQGSSLQLFGVTKDGLAILQDRINVDAHEQSAVEVEAERRLPSESSDPEWSKCPFLVYSDSRYSYKHQCNYRYGVFWNGHTRFIAGTGEEWYEEVEGENHEEFSWFHPDVGGYVEYDWDDTLDQLQPGSDIDVPDTRSEYADDPELLIATASSQVDYMSNSLDVASVSDVMDEFSSSEIGGCISGLFEIAAVFMGLFFKFFVYGLIGLIVFNVINVSTGWFDDVSTDEMGVLWIVAALTVWSGVGLTKYVWNRIKERNHV